MQRLVKTIYPENGELFCVSNGLRTRLAQCDVKLEILEEVQDIPMLGGYKVKKYHMAVILCNHVRLTRPVDTAFFKTVAAYDMTVDVQRLDGVWESIPLDNLYPKDIELDGEWKFEIEGRPELIKRLLCL